MDTTGRNNLAQLRSLEDWFLRYQLQAVPGVAEVAPLGGFVRQYQVTVDPNRLAGYGVTIDKVVAAVRAGNNDVGGRLVEFTGREYMVRGRGYARSVSDLEQVSLGVTAAGVPILVRDVGSVTLGPDLRRGIADLNGEGETVSGIVVMRQGENALRVIERVKAKLKELEPGLPPGVKVVTAYDRSELILASIDNLKRTLIEELAVVALVILIFLWHVPSAVIPIVTIPVAVLISFVPMRLMGINANIMSLGGIAIAVGAMVDAAIVVVEQTHKKLEHADASWSAGDYQRAIVAAVKEVGGPSFFALLVIAVSFLPVLTLEAQEGRLFKPLAYTKNFAMIVAAVLAITLDPALRLLFFRKEGFRLWPRWLGWIVNGVLVGKIHSEEKHPLSRVLMRLYAPVVEWSLRWKWLVLAGAVALVAVTVPIYQGLGSEFMPPLDEGTLLFMPTTLPGISVAQAGQLLQMQDRILMRFPEVERVLGKAGRAETPTDPAPLSMMETVVTLKPKSEWRHVATWYDRWPEWIKPLCGRITPDRISTDQLVNEMNDALRFPGVSNAWTMPVKNRIDMLTTGIRTPVGIKIYGPDLAGIERIGTAIESVLPRVARDAQRVRRAGERRLLPGLRFEARSTGALRDERGRCRGGSDVGDRRRERQHGNRGSRAIPDQRALLPRFAQFDRAAAPGAGAGDGRQGADSAGGDRDAETGERPLHAAQRKRHVERLRLRGRGRARRGELRGGGQAGGARERRHAARLHDRLERAVRSHGARARAAEGGAAADAVPDGSAAVPEHAQRREDRHHSAGGAVLGGGRHLAAQPAGLQHEHRRVGGVDRADGRGRRNRRVHAAVSRPGLRGAAAGGAACAPTRTCARRSCTGR